MRKGQGLFYGDTHSRSWHRLRVKICVIISRGKGTNGVYKFSNSSVSVEISGDVFKTEILD